MKMKKWQFVELSRLCSILNYKTIHKNEGWGVLSSWRCRCFLLFPIHPLTSCNSVSVLLSSGTSCCPQTVRLSPPLLLSNAEPADVPIFCFPSASKFGIEVTQHDRLCGHDDKNWFDHKTRWLHQLCWPWWGRKIGRTWRFCWNLIIGELWSKITILKIVIFLTFVFNQLRLGQIAASSTAEKSNL